MQTARMLRCSRFDCTGKRAHASVGCRMKSCGCVCSAPEVSCNALKLSCACTHQPRICAGRWPRRFLRSDGKRTGGLPCHGLESASVGRREGLDPSKVQFRCPSRRSRLKHASLDLGVGVPAAGGPGQRRFFGRWLSVSRAHCTQSCFLGN